MVITATEETRRGQKTLYGLYNQGSTCYLNSVLQLLFMTPEFHHRLELNSKTDQVLKTLFENLKKGPCRTENITTHFRIQNVRKQRDAAEYLELILNGMSHSASEVFRGELTYSTKCNQGHSMNEETNLFWTLPLPLRDEINGLFSVENGFERIFRKKMFNGDNKAYCKDCGENTEAERECVMKTTPQVLVLLLKRFVFDYSIKSHIKSNCTVEIPTTLYLKKKKKKYALYGIVDHWGSLRSGHYTAIIQSSDDKTWYEFNDTSVQKAEEQPTNYYRSNSAYLLTYREVRDPSESRNHETNTSSVAIDVGPTGRHSPVPLPRTCTLHKGIIIALIVCGVVLVIILVLGLSLGLTRK